MLRTTLKRAAQLGLATMLAALVAPATASAGLIVNGSFELGTDIPSPKGYKTLTKGSTDITGWTISSGTIDYIGKYWQAADGTRSLDLSGVSAGGITLTQTIATVVGETYMLTFALAGNPDGPPPVKVLTAIVTSGAVIQDTYSFDTTGMTKKSMGWKTYGFSFTAGSTATVVSFKSGTGGAYGPALDNVNLEHVVRVLAVPEPASIAMCGTAVLAVGGVALRRRKVRVAGA